MKRDLNGNGKKINSLPEIFRVIDISSYISIVRI